MYREAKGVVKILEEVTEEWPGCQHVFFYAEEIT